MVRAILTSKETWVRAMSLDEFTGLDPIGYKGASAVYGLPSERLTELRTSSSGGAGFGRGYVVHAW